jgi:hypothetical protein
MKRARIVALSVVLAIATLGVGLLAARTIAAASPHVQTYWPVAEDHDQDETPPTYLTVAVGGAQSLQQYLQAELPLCMAGKCRGSGLGAIPSFYLSELEKYPAPFCYLKADIEYRTALLDASKFSSESTPAAATAVVKDGLHEVAMALHDYGIAKC